jgi:hypothetical protein
MLSSRGHNAEATITEGHFSHYTPHHVPSGLEPVPQSPEPASPRRSHVPTPSISISSPTIHAPAPKPHSDFTATSPEEGNEALVGGGTPKAKWIETLQSKRAWDALIHGSFS